MDNYYPTKPIPYEIREHITIYFEEGLHRHALEFLNEIAVPDSTVPLPIPPPSIFSLILTLTVHPSFTTRADDHSALEIRNLAYTYLTKINRTVGPCAARLSEAYVWPDHTLSRRGLLGRRRREDSHSPAKGDDEPINTPFAGPKSLRSCSQDFWAVVGWAFRCSHAFPNRWNGAWRHWLEYMIDVLERDWNSCVADEEPSRSLIVAYIRGVEQRARILRSIFADSERSVNEFKEVWGNETKLKRNITNKDRGARTKELDIDNDKFGDYLDSSSDDSNEGDFEQQEDSKPGHAEQVDEIPLDLTSCLGGWVATTFRLRLLALLVRVTEYSDTIFGTTWSLFDKCIDYIRPLPLPAFASVISPTALSCFPSTTNTYFIRVMANSLIQSGVKSPKGALDQRSLVDCYLPFAANTNLVVDNAKMSICAEALLRTLNATDDLHFTNELEAAVEEGIQNREFKANRSRGAKGIAKGEGEEKSDRSALNDSATRMRMFVHVLKTTQN